MIDHHARIDFFELRAAFIVKFADQCKIRIEKIADNTSKRNKFGTVANSEITPSFFAGFLFENRNQSLPRRTRQNCTRQHDIMICFLFCKRFSDLFKRPSRILQRKRTAFIARSRHDHERNIRIQDRVFMTRRSPNSFLICRNRFVEIGFLNRRSAFIDQIDRTLIDIYADNFQTAAGKCRRHACAQFSQTDN
jgi:hypothetical protein